MDSKESPLAEVALGVTVLLFGFYAVAGPGRIDMIDGQLRYEAAVRWVSLGTMEFKDPTTRRFGVLGVGGTRHSRYGVGGVLAGAPFVALVPEDTDPDEDGRRFAFMLSSALGGALACSGLLVLLVMLGASLPVATAWAAICGVATLVFPTAVSSFTHTQTAALATWSVAAAVKAGRDDQRWSAVAGGGLAGLLFTFDTYLLALVPTLAIATLHRPIADDAGWRTFGRQVVQAVLGRGDHRGFARYWWFVAGTAPGMLLQAAHNFYRFGDPLHSGKTDGLPAAHAFWGNPLDGFLGLLVSPGKGIVWFSPLILLSLVGLPGLWRRSPAVTAAVALSSATLVAMLSPLAFFGGDWCWGPRYLVVLLPLWGLAWPWATGVLARQWVRAPLVALSIFIQVLGVSLDHHRFFFERSLPDFFWANAPWFYFRESQLLARPREVLRSWKERDIVRPHFYHNPRGITFCTFGFDPKVAATREQGFGAFFYWRPWPYWCSRLGDECPFSASWLLGLFAATMLFGGGLMALGLRGRRHED